jgi:regulator of sirC expression with transglutaminase-like and TPR domain
MSAAVTHYQQALDIAQRLVRRDPENTEWERDVAVVYAKLARWHQQAGEASRALELYQEGRAIMHRIGKLSPEHAGWKAELAWFDAQISHLSR